MPQPTATAPSSSRTRPGGSARRRQHVLATVIGLVAVTLLAASVARALEARSLPVAEVVSIAGTGSTAREAPRIAILDTGIDVSHPHLNVVGGASCLGDGSIDDGDGHGTAVAGMAAATAGGQVPAGPAAGAALLAVRVAARADAVRDADLACGLQWVAAHAASIDVAVVSIGGDVDQLDRTCEEGAPRSGSIHAAVCAVAAAGVPMVVSAGNDGRDAGSYEPAAFADTIAVAAITDSDGRPGGIGPAVSCEPGEPAEPDDSLARYSNHGSVVDVAAPGTCVEVLLPGGGTEVVSGTSFAVGTVAGQIAAAGPAATGTSADAVRDWIARQGTREPGIGYPVLRP